MTIEGLILGICLGVFLTVLLVIFLVVRQIAKEIKQAKQPKKDRDPFEYSPATGNNPIFDAVKMSDRSNLAWFATLRDGQDDVKKSLILLLQSMELVVKGNTEILVNIKAMKTSLQSDRSDSGAPRKVEDFINSLEYVHDRYADNPRQKKAVKEIISNIREKYVVPLKTSTGNE